MLVGRDRERDAIGELIGGARSSRGAALVVRGEPGMGKTALLQDARERAVGMQVLAARGIESESELPFAGLHQLVRPALDGVGDLPEPQARALATALGLSAGAVPERFLVYSACLTLLSELAERRPVLCLVDDAQWLDAASAEGLEFVARRLDAEGIVMLFGAREGDARRFVAEGIPSLELAGLDAPAADALLARVAAGAAPQVRAALVAQTHGNALALVELPAALTDAQLAGAEPLPDALPMTRRLEAVFLGRLSDLPEATRSLLVIVAADDSEDLALVARAAAALGAGPEALEPAERAGLVAVRGARVVFRHPLVRSAVYGGATSGERRAAHAALAGALDGDDPQADRRAWHLAAAAVEHDPRAVGELDAAAVRAEERGGNAAAARAWERAAQLSADPGERARRLVRAARDLSLAGQDARAVALAERARLPGAPAVLRAEAARVRATAAVRGGRPGDAVPELVALAAELGADEPALAVQLVMHATVAGWQGGGPATMLETAGALAGIAPDPGDEDSRVIAGSIRGFAAMLTGDAATAVPLLSETAAWGAVDQDPRNVFWAGFAAAWLGDMAAFDALLQRSARLARERGEAGTLSDVLGVRAVNLALVEQRYRAASVAAEEAVALARELDAGNFLLMPWAALAIVAAVQGRADEARSLAEQAIELARSRDVVLRASAATYALALVDLGAARWREALECLEGLADPSDPAVALTAPDRIEAAVRAGRRDRAAELLEGYEAWAAYSAAPATRPRLALCRALVAEGGDATAPVEEAVRLAADAPPFDRARIRLLAGEHLRRERRRADAREHLRAAIAGFEELGAEPWAARARDELAATGETVRRRDPDAAAALTPKERQIARLVGEGLTNKEVAAQLYLSPRTIDSHLRNAFAKLGVTSRTQLVRADLGDG